MKFLRKISCTVGHHKFLFPLPVEKFGVKYARRWCKHCKRTEYSNMGNGEWLAEFWRSKI